MVEEDVIQDNACGKGERGLHFFPQRKIVFLKPSHIQSLFLLYEYCL